MNDPVNHPEHYISANGMETIKVIQEFTSGLKGIEAFCIGNALKYICRFDKKGGTVDIQKAIWYLDHLVAFRQGENSRKDF